MRFSIRRCDLKIAFAGFVHANGVGDLFQARMQASRWSRSARFEWKSVRPSDCLPKMPRKPSTWFSRYSLASDRRPRIEWSGSRRGREHPDQSVLGVVSEATLLVQPDDLNERTAVGWRAQ